MSSDHEYLWNINLLRLGMLDFLLEIIQKGLNMEYKTLLVSSGLQYKKGVKGLYMVWA